MVACSSWVVCKPEVAVGVWDWEVLRAGACPVRCSMPLEGVCRDSA